MKTIIGNETSVPFTIRGEQATAVREAGWWRIEPDRLAVSRANRFRHLRDLRVAVRAANRSKREA